MALVKVRNAANDGWIDIGGQVSITQQDAAPATTYPGMLWLDTDETNEMLHDQELSYVHITAGTSWVHGSTSADVVVPWGKNDQFVISDMNSDWNTSTYTFTAPMDGVYDFEFHMLWTSFSFVVNKYFQTKLFVDGSPLFYWRYTSHATHTAYIGVQGAASLILDAAQTVQMKMLQTAGAAIGWHWDTTPGSLYTWLTISQTSGIT
jgi:hypothetical protein